MKYRLLIPLLAVIACLCNVHAIACTTFCYRDQDHLLFGKNFDFYMDDGHIIINKRSVTKAAFPIPGEPSIRWTSKYGSISFNQLGREFPFGGMNEKGLVVEQMYLADTRYPEPDQRAGVAELQWIQYQLDNSATVEDVVATDSRIRISKISAPIHFLICDALGNVATFEYIDGRLVVRRNDNLRVCALTNDTYDKSMAYFDAAFEKSENYVGTSSFARFVRTGVNLRQFDTKRPLAYSFEILAAAAQPDATMWSIVYDVKQMIIHLTTRDNPQMRSIRLSDFDFSCNSPALFLDVDYKIQSAVDFRPYSSKENAAIIQRSLEVLATKPEFSNVIPSKEEQQALANYPETTRCSGQP